MKKEYIGNDSITLSRAFLVFKSSIARLLPKNLFIIPFISSADRVNERAKVYADTIKAERRDIIEPYCKVVLLLAEGYLSASLFMKKRIRSMQPKNFAAHRKAPVVAMTAAIRGPL